MVCSDVKLSQEVLLGLGVVLISVVAVDTAWT